MGLIVITIKRNGNQKFPFEVNLLADDSVNTVFGGNGSESYYHFNFNNELRDALRHGLKVPGVVPDKNKEFITLVNAISLDE